MAEKAALLAVIAALAALIVLLVRRKVRGGGGCCGTHERMEAKIRVRDRNPAHYPYRATLAVGGMTCANCARRVENALNALDGVWARVDLGTGRARLRLKDAPDERRLREAVLRAGYVATEFHMD